MDLFVRLLFLTNIACLVMGHELDAIYQKEWRFFTRLITADDELGYRMFVALHVPLLVWVLWQIDSPAFQIGFDLFVWGHAAVHFMLRQHPLVQFNNHFSRAWIFGGVLLSGLHLVLLAVG